MADIVYRIEVTGLGGRFGGGTTKKAKSEDVFPYKKSNSLRVPSTSNILKGNVSTTGILASAGISLAKYVLNSSVSTIELRTGDSYRQQEVQFGLNLLSTIGGSALAGATMGGPIGAAIGAAIGVVKVGADALISEYKADIRRELNSEFSQSQQKIYDYASYGSNRTGGVLY